MLKMGDRISPRYTAPKISAICYLFRTFSLLIMGDTERPRYTGFRGLLVRGITALQCIWLLSYQIWKINKTNRPAGTFNKLWKFKRQFLGMFSLLRQIICRFVNFVDLTEGAKIPTLTTSGTWRSPVT